MGANASQLTHSPSDINQAMEKLQVIEEQLGKEQHNQSASKIIARSQSSYAHFSDYSMFPDRFNPVPKNTPIVIDDPKPMRTPIIIEPIQDPKADHVFDPDPLRYQRSQSEGGTTNSLPTNPGFLTKFNFRLRSSSATEQQIQIDSNLLNDKADSSQGSLDIDKRPRSSSHSRMYKGYDFGTIHEKEGTSVDTTSWPIPLDNIDEATKILQRGTSVPAPDSMEAIAAKAKRVRKTSESGPRYGFFDYSMIPDKDPRCFNKKT